MVWISLVGMLNGIINRLDHAHLYLASFNWVESSRCTQQAGQLPEKRHSLEPAFNLESEPLPGSGSVGHRDRALTASSTVLFMVKTRSSRVSLNMLVRGSVVPQSISSQPLGMRLRTERIAPKPLLSINSTFDRSRTIETAPPAR